MRTYIIGSETHMRSAADLLESLGMTAVIPPEDSAAGTFRDEIIGRIGRLLECDSALICDGWQCERAAKVEYTTAVQAGMVIISESLLEESFNIVNDIKDAVFRSTGLNIEDYSSASRNRDLLYARMLFVHFCRMNDMKLAEIGRLVNRNHATLSYMIRKYDDEMLYNRRFRDLAERTLKELHNNE